CAREGPTIDSWFAYW
nr:immunoglobulin heavy chain junction region [Mus musculus]NSM09283.1 immunoglobulin heavy chain junction region [Mus musculus]